MSADNLASIRRAGFVERPPQAVFEGALNHFYLEAATKSGRSPGLKVTRSHWRWVQAATVGAVAVVAVIIASLATGSPSVETRPSLRSSAVVALNVPAKAPLTIRIPKEALHHDGINWSKVGPLVPLYSGSRRLGYLNKENVEYPPIEAQPFLRLSPSLPQSIHLCRIIPVGGPFVPDVYNASHVVIGHLYPDSGYVPAGSSPQCN
jgi:hypothetical protein